MSNVDRDHRFGVLERIGARRHSFTDIQETDDGLSVTISGGSKDGKKVHLRLGIGKKLTVERLLEIHEANDVSLRLTPSDEYIVLLNRRSDELLPKEVQDHQG